MRALDELRRPRTRGDCAATPRPCPFSSCRHHLTAGPESCALDVADRGGVTLEQVGEILNLTRERVRQIEVAALAKLGRLGELLGGR